MAPWGAVSTVSPFQSQGDPEEQDLTQARVTDSKPVVLNWGVILSMSGQEVVLVSTSAEGRGVTVV